MDYVEWCDFVLDKIVQIDAESDSGFVADNTLIEMTFGDDSKSDPNFRYSLECTSLYEAAWELGKIGLIKSESGRMFYVTNSTRTYLKNKLRLWQQICSTELDEVARQLLSIVNHLGIEKNNRCAKPVYVAQEPILDALDWPQGVNLLMKVTRVLEDTGFIDAITTQGPHFEIKPTFRGCVWEYRRAFTTEAMFINSLVKEWETTSVEFKRELKLETNDQKAEFVKDLIALGNTQTSGRRWLIIGFDNDTRNFVGFSDPDITQNRIEQIVSRYIDPNLSLRYETADYMNGKLAKLEIIREPIKLPYRFKIALQGSKKVINEGQIFVRHGSQVEPPSDSELKAITEEAERAKRL